MEALRNHKFEFGLLFERAKSVWSLTNKILLFVPPAVLVYLLFTLMLNSSRGFDITDESFYVLWASQPEHVLASTSQFGYYTRLLYLISGKSIAVFRILGVLSLLGAAWFFSVALDRYWNFASGQVFNTRDRWKVITLISISTLAYYRFWLITPSYNWLALISCFIVGAGLLRATTENYYDRGLSRPKSWMLMDGLIVGLGGGLAFMAKPTSALVLALTALFWVGVHSRRCKLKLFFLAAICASCLFLLMHAMVFKGGIIPYFFQLRDGLEFGRILGGGHSIGSLFWQAVDNFRQIPAKVFRLTPSGFMLFPIVLLSVWWMKRRGQETNAILVHSIFPVIFCLFIWYRLWKTGQWSLSGIGFGGIAFSLVLVLSAWLTLCAFKQRLGEKRFIAFRRLVVINVLLFMLAFAQAFGTNNLIVRQMSFAYVFLATGALYTAFWIDKYVDRVVLGNIIPVLISVSVLMVLIHAFNHPYRLPGNIDSQVVKSSFLLGNGFLDVDTPTAAYISDLKRVAQEAGWKAGKPLIDLTGGSPGATVILGARIMGRPWLMGGYKGSNESVVAVLKKIPRPILGKAWVLTAPEGVRSLSVEILSKFDLEFPEGYTAVGKVRTGHRNELQILWKPLTTIYSCR